MIEMTGSQVFQRTQQEEPRVGRRSAPIKMMTVTAITEGAAQTIITAPATRALELRNLMVSNITAVDAIFALYAVPPGEVANASTFMMRATIKAESCDDLAVRISRLYESGWTLRVFCNTASAVKFMGMVEEIF